MAVTFDNSALSVQTLTSSLTVALTVGSNAVLLAGFMVGSFTNSISACAYGGQALTFLGEAVISAGAGLSVHIWGLTAPAAGVANLSANLAGGIPGIFQMVGLSYLGAKAVNPFSPVIAGSASAALNVNISISSSSTDLAVVFWSTNIDLHSTNGTNRFRDAAHFAYEGNDLAGTAGVASLSCTCSGASNVAFIGINIAFSAASTGIYNFCLTGCGL